MLVIYLRLYLYLLFNFNLKNKSILREKLFTYMNIRKVAGSIPRGVIGIFH